MPVYRRYKGRKVTRADKNYDKATWVANVMIDGVRHHKSIKSAKTKAEAEEQEDLIVAKIRHGEFDLLKDKTKFADFVDEIYLPYCRLNNANYKQKIYETNSLKRFFKNILLKAVSPSLCENYKKWRLEQKKRCQKCISDTHTEDETCLTTVSNSTVNRDLTSLKKLLNIAVANRKIKDNPMRFVKMLPEPPSRVRFLSDVEKRKLLAAAAHDKRLTAIILIGLLTGWRKGQTLEVRKTDLDFINKAVTIKQSKQSPPRKVPVSLMAWAIFINLAENAKDYLFVNRDGNRLGDFKDSWWEALSEAGIKNFHFHDLRHTFATDMISGGARDFTVQAALGHANMKTTSIYAHIKNEYLRAALEMVSDKNKH